jgi:hypothetical protein
MAGQVPWRLVRHTSARIINSYRGLRDSFDCRPRTLFCAAPGQARLLRNGQSVDAPEPRGGAGGIVMGDSGRTVTVLGLGPGATLPSTACRIGKDDARGSLVSLAKLSASVLD